MSFYVKLLQKCGPLKFAVKKKLKNDVAAFPRLSLSSKDNVVSGRPAFESRSLQTLKAFNFDALWPAGSQTNFFERSDLYL